MKRIIAMVLVLLSIGAVLFAAGSQEAAGNPKIVFVAADMKNESQAFSSRMFEKYGPEYGFDVSILDAEGNAEKEAAAVSNAIAMKAKAVFVNPNDINAIIPSLMQAKQAGLVVGMYSSDLPAASAEIRDFFVGVNDTMAGQTAAQAFIDHFPNGAKIVEIGGQAGHDAQIKRHDGFNEVIAGTNIINMDYKACQQWATDQALAIAEDMITKYGTEIDGIFCHWDNGVTGIINAVQAANLNKELYIIGVDGNRAGFQQVRDGWQSVTIMQNFENMTKQSLQLAKDVLAGKTVEKINFIPLDAVDLNNIDSFTAPEW